MTLPVPVSCDEIIVTRRGVGSARVPSTQFVKPDESKSPTYTLVQLTGP